MYKQLTGKVLISIVVALSAIASTLVGWTVPAGLNTFEGAPDWAPPAGWLPISSRA